MLLKLLLPGLVVFTVLYGLPLLVTLLINPARSSPRAWRLSGAVLALLVIHTVFSRWLPDVLPSTWSEGLRWNWWGKGGALMLTLAALAMLPRSLRLQAGCQWPRRDGWRLTLAVTAAWLCVTWWWASLTGSGAPRAISLETICFQATLPGLDEELLYRGVAMGLLMSALGPLAGGRPWLGIRWHWGAIPLTLIFAGIHVGQAPQDLMVEAAAFHGLNALWLYWLRERTGSVWCCVLAHNLMNLGSVLVTARAVA